MLKACYQCGNIHDQARRCRPAWAGPKVTQTRQRIAQRDNYVCQECGNPTPLNAGHADHIEPRSMGGSDADSNLRWTCTDCNLTKGSS